MKLSVKKFLDTYQNPSTRKGYRQGIKKFREYYGKTAEEILNQRKDDLTQKTGENLIEYKNRAVRFSKEIEKFHGYLLNKGFATNSARNLTIGIRQLFRFYQMPVQIRAGSKVTKTVKTSKSFPLRVEHVRRMFAIADIRERVILSMATDLGLRIGDFIAIQKEDIPSLDQETPIPFDTMTGKEEVVAHGFLSQETVDLLKVYLPTLTKKGNPYLFPSNGKSHISDEWLSKLLKRLAQKAKIPMNKKSLTFHCFRKMLLSASIDSGIGLTAGKKLVGKAIAQSDDTYLTTVNLKKKFIDLKKFQTIQQKPKVETETIETLQKAVSKLQEDLTLQQTITNTISKENLKIKNEFARIQPIIDFVNTYNTVKEQQKLLEFVKAEAEIDPLPYNPNITFDETLEQQMNEISEKEGISKAEAMAKIADDRWTRLLESQKQMEKRCKEKGIPVTEEDYKKQLEAAIKKNQRMNAKYQRRLDKINNRKD
ncbi:MAG: tyrosine-type recombinase/integrase [Candidatus Bathyarchaeota archaeon]|nr:tyrosine-type recombinase/integrase [Candidatus Bathyarchaeota archaeon]